MQLVQTTQSASLTRDSLSCLPVPCVSPIPLEKVTLVTSRSVTHRGNSAANDLPFVAKISIAACCHQQHRHFLFYFEQFSWFAVRVKWMQSPSVSITRGETCPRSTMGEKVKAALRKNWATGDSLSKCKSQLQVRHCAQSRVLYLDVRTAA